MVACAVVVPVEAFWRTLKAEVGVPSMSDNFVNRPVWSAAVVVMVEVPLSVTALVLVPSPELPAI